MIRLFGIALGAGVTSAVLFAVAGTGSPAALVLAYLAPLPIMIVGLGFTHAVGGAAALIGCGAIGVAMGPLAALLFLVALGLPAWHLPRLALLNRPLAAGPAGAPALRWFPIPTLLLNLAAAAAGPVLVIGVALVWRFGGYEQAIAALSTKLAALLAREGLPSAFPFADLVRLAPLLMAASSVVMLAVNLWLAARSVQLSSLLVRPWPNLPDALHLPRLTVAGFAALGAASLLPGPFGIAAAVLAAALGVLFAFEGLAAAHVLTRGLTARIVTLTAIYLATALLMPWPLLALALLGCIDCLVPSLRQGSGIRITKLPTRRQ
ncbi:MAG: hypothetical protein ACRYGP_08855 [Janthinobacterium lividum]